MASYEFAGYPCHQPGGFAALDSLSQRVEVAGLEAQYLQGVAEAAFLLLLLGLEVCRHAFDLGCYLIEVK